MRGMWMLLPGLLLAASACGRASSGEEPGPVHDPVRTEVMSNYAIPLEIFVSGSGINHKLGTIYPGTTRSFVVPQNLSGGQAVEFEAHPTAPGGPQFRSGPVLLAPGRVIDFKITPQLFNSTVTVRE